MASTFLTLLNLVWKNSQKNGNGVQVSKRFFVVWVFSEGGVNDFQRGLKFRLVMHMLGLRQSLCLRSFALNKFLKISSYKRKLAMLKYGLAADDRYKSPLCVVMKLKSSCVAHSVTQLSLSSNKFGKVSFKITRRLQSPVSYDSSLSKRFTQLDSCVVSPNPTLIPWPFRK